MKSNTKIAYATLVHTIRTMGIYISLPILALHFNSIYSIILASFLVGLPTACSTLFGFLSYFIEKKVGTKKTLTIALVLLIVSYFGYYVFTNLLLLIICALLTGISCILWEPTMKNVFSESGKNVDFAFRMRYVSICIAGILGPIICNMVSQYFSIKSALLVSALFFFVALPFVLIISGNITTSATNTHERKKGFDSIKDALPVLKNTQYLMLLLGGTLVFLVFSQFETVFSLFLKEFFLSPERLFSILISLNSFFSMVFQIIYMYAFKKREHTSKVNRINILVGNLSFIMAFSLFAIAKTAIPIYIIAVLIYSLGEVLVIPATDIAIDDIAPSEQKPLYFGIAEIRQAGFTLGPILCGVMLQYFSTTVVCLFGVVVFFLSTFFFFPNRKKTKSISKY